MVDPFFLAVTRTPSIAPSGPLTCPDSLASACAAPAPRLEVASASARAAVDNNACFGRIMGPPREGVSKRHPGVRSPPTEGGLRGAKPLGRNHRVLPPPS